MHRDRATFLNGLLAKLLLAAVATYSAAAWADAPMSAVQLAAANASIENTAAAPAKSVLTADDEKFLDDLERRGIQFFIAEADPVTGLMPDRAKANGGAETAPSSIASVGFGLTALCVGDQRGWVSHQEAYDRSSLRVTSRFLRDHGPKEHGTYYHFLDMHTGQRVWNCEVSNIDTALLIAGVLAARQHFAGTELATIADDLYEQVDWPWLLGPNTPGQATAPSGILYMGWTPENGFIKSQWSNFSEGPLIYLLAMGLTKASSTAAESWRESAASARREFTPA